MRMMMLAVLRATMLAKVFWVSKLGGSSGLTKHTVGHWASFGVLLRRHCGKALLLISRDVFDEPVMRSYEDNDGNQKLFFQCCTILDHTCACCMVVVGVRKRA
jgi:hypothetical protein